MFGTDATPHVHNYPQQLFGGDLYSIYYRFLETADEYFDYPSHASRQGRWNVYGQFLPEDVLRKVYRENALKLLNTGAR